MSSNTMWFTSVGLFFAQGVFLSQAHADTTVVPEGMPVAMTVQADIELSSVAVVIIASLHNPDTGTTATITNDCVFDEEKLKCDELGWADVYGTCDASEGLDLYTIALDNFSPPSGIVVGDVTVTAEASFGVFRNDCEVTNEHDEQCNSWCNSNGNGDGEALDVWSLKDLETGVTGSCNFLLCLCDEVPYGNISNEVIIPSTDSPTEEDDGCVRPG